MQYETLSPLASCTLLCGDPSNGTSPSPSFPLFSPEGHRLTQLPDSAGDVDTQLTGRELGTTPASNDEVIMTALLGTSPLSFKHNPGASDGLSVSKAEGK